MKAARRGMTVATADERRREHRAQTWAVTQMLAAAGLRPAAVRSFSDLMCQSVVQLWALPAWQEQTVSWFRLVCKVGTGNPTSSNEIRSRRARLCR